MAANHRHKPKWFRSAERQELVSSMNATKWQEATEAMRLLPGGPPRFRVKDIHGPVPSETAWDREWFYHPRPHETIEWLEIDPDSRAAELLAVLGKLGVPVTV